MNGPLYLPIYFEIVMALGPFWQLIHGGYSHPVT